MKRLAAVVAMVAVLAGCETVPETPPVAPVADIGAAWAARERRLGALEHWDTAGRVAVRADAESFTAGLRWDQDGGRYRILLSGPLGQGGARLEGAPGEVVLTTARGETFRAARPDDLLYQQLGWRMPLGGLRYWLVGISDPSAPLSRLELDGSGLPTRLDQGDWVVEFEGWGTFEGEPMPTRMRVHNARVDAKVALQSWTVAPP